MRAIKPNGAVRAGVLGSLSAISSPIASSVMTMRIIRRSEGGKPRSVEMQQADMSRPAHDCRSRQRAQAADASQKKTEQHQHGISPTS